jgi:ribosome-associated protein
VTSRQLAEQAARLLYERKAEDIQIMDLRKLGGVSDFFIVASGISTTHVRSLADHLQVELKQSGVKPWHIEGYQAERWVLMDYVNVVVHIFHPQTREFYLLERLWGDAEKLKIDFVVSQ